MPRLDPDTTIVDATAYGRAVERFRSASIVLPTFAELADPARIPASIGARLHAVDQNTPHALNLFRVHWHNSAPGRECVAVPDHVALPEALTGVPARIIVALGNRFPLIQAHKVLAAYGCLAPRIVTGRFDPTTQKAVWPSTGNYCRGGVAISRIMGCRGVAVLPEGMSQERFRWLERWVLDPTDIVKTPGSESNVKEIYDKCAELGCDPGNIIFNQFREFGNHLAHYLCTGRAFERIAEAAMAHEPGLRVRAFVAATGSAGTLGAGDYLKERYGACIVAAEALECPTMLYNGFGEHNIQGIGDKHIPLIHNVMNTDAVTAVSDRATDTLDLLFNTEVGRDYLARRGVPPSVLNLLPAFGLSSICNVVAAIKTARHFRFGANDVILTVATDGADLYASEREKVRQKYFGGGFDTTQADKVFGQHVLGASTDHFLELTERDRTRIFNLGYFTWVEQQGVSIDDFNARRDQSFWRDLRARLPVWDTMIAEFNRRAGN